MADGELVLRFASEEELLSEYAQNLSHGRAFVRGQTNLPLFSKTTLVIEHPGSGALKSIGVEVVMVMAEGPMRGAALQFLDRCDEALAGVGEFVRAGGAGNEHEHEHEHDDEHERADGDGDGEGNGDEDGHAHAHDDGHAHGLDHELDDEVNDDGGAAEARRNLSKERQERMRNLPVAERMKVARGPILDDRVLLERIYGSGVWEALLRNTKITIPEVARMARKGTLPRPLLDLIVENESWVRQSLVRRSLLGNPRLSSDAAVKVLRTLPARELKLVPQQTAYPATVRAAAQRLMRGG